MRNPCKQTCEGRTPTCHAECHKYAEWVEYREAIKKAKAMDDSAEKVLAERSLKNVKFRHTLQKKGKSPKCF